MNWHDWWPLLLAVVAVAPLAWDVYHRRRNQHLRPYWQIGRLTWRDHPPRPPKGPDQG